MIIIFTDFLTGKLRVMIQSETVFSIFGKLLTIRFDIAHPTPDVPLWVAEQVVQNNVHVCVLSVISPATSKRVSDKALASL